MDKTEKTKQTLSENIPERCLKCGEIVTPYGGLLRLKDDVVLHMECAMRWNSL
tara:strand:+ start:9386 stop:9544 length:159 start_codon:yes stop_codon:yes gene_type:complete